MSRFGVIGALTLLTATTQAAPPPPPASTGFGRLLACRAIGATAERLACFDRESAALDAQAQQHEVVVLDADEVRRTRRSLFGLTLPSLAILGESKAKSNAPAEGTDQITETIAEAHQNPLGAWAFTLAAGAHWIQSDVEPLARDPRPGMTVVIRRAALGSYLAKIDNQIAIRVKRVQ